jgi:hypothetical protein
MVIASVSESLLWFHPFGPLTKNVPVAIAAVVLLRGGFQRRWQHP